MHYKLPHWFSNFVDDLALWMSYLRCSAANWEKAENLKKIATVNVDPD